MGHAWYVPCTSAVLNAPKRQRRDPHQGLTAAPASVLRISGCAAIRQQDGLAHVTSQKADVKEPRGGSTSGLLKTARKSFGASSSDQYLAMTATGALPQPQSNL